MFIKTWNDFLDKEHFKVVKMDRISDTIVDIVRKHAGKDAVIKPKVELPMAAGISW